VRSCRKRAADPVEYASARLTNRLRRKIGEARGRKVSAQRLGQRLRSDIEILFHRPRSTISNQVDRDSASIR
jgi:hypothetical protein